MRFIRSFVKTRNAPCQNVRVRLSGLGCEKGAALSNPNIPEIFLTKRLCQNVKYVQWPCIIFKKRKQCCRSEWRPRTIDILIRLYRGKLVEIRMESDYLQKSKSSFPPPVWNSRTYMSQHKILPKPMSVVKMALQITDTDEYRFARKTSNATWFWNSDRL